LLIEGVVVISAKERPESHLTLHAVVVFAWVATLLFSALPNILWQEFIGTTTIGHFWARMLVMALLVVVTFVWKAVYPLRRYLVVFAVLYLAGELLNWVGTIPRWQQWIAQIDNTFSAQMLDVQLRRLAVAFIMIGLLLLMGYRTRDFYLVKGQLDAPAEPVRWMGIERPISWRRLGLILSVCISSGLLVFLLIAGKPTLETLVKALPFLPLVVLFAASNAFGEEMGYRAALLAPLYPVVGKQQSMLLMGAWFGLAHFYGVPYGVVGVIMSGFLGWLLSKSMLETKGFFWAWFIHLCQDVLAFSFIAIGSIIPGG
jgi:hypothetical protein